MVIKRYDKMGKYISRFNTRTGAYLRTGILEDGRDTGAEPFGAEFPELIDVGIMGHCIHGKQGLCLKAGIGCYQDGLHAEKENMSLEHFKQIVNECRGKTFQFALGGAGDPDQHEHFEEILAYSRENRIIPNYTTSGLGMTKKLAQISRKYCGAVAVSWYRSDYTEKAIQCLLECHVLTSIHYVLGRSTIDEAIWRLKKRAFPKGIYAVVFLLHKPVGLGRADETLSVEDKRLKEFFTLLDKEHFEFKTGFDSCTVPGILSFMENVDIASIDTCEGGRFSCYITSDMKLLPCSFDNQEQRWAYDISNDSIENGWKSKEFEAFRNHLRQSCPNCGQRELCMGGCPIRPEIVLCENPRRTAPYTFG